MPDVHRLSRRAIRRFALEQRDAGRLYDTRHAELDDHFRGSIDRFCEIAWAFRGSPRVLDVGSGAGLLLALLKLLGHDVVAVDVFDHSSSPVYAAHGIACRVCNVEADPLPFADDSFDAVSCCQAMEHFTHSHLRPVLEMKRVLRPGGILEIDVPNAVSFRNRSRMLRGRHITYDYETYYLDPVPVVYKGREYYPDRHNREFTRDELRLLLQRAGFARIDVRFLRSRRYRTGLQRMTSVATALRDLVPSLRKSLIAFAVR